MMYTLAAVAGRLTDRRYVVKPATPSVAMTLTSTRAWMTEQTTQVRSHCPTDVQVGQKLAAHEYCPEAMKALQLVWTSAQVAVGVAAHAAGGAGGGDAGPGAGAGAGAGAVVAAAHNPKLQLWSHMPCRPISVHVAQKCVPHL